MLILARKTGQSIILGDDIEIVVIEVRGEHVRLGITAPRTVQVYRKELLEQMRAENIGAAMVDADSMEVLPGGNKGSIKPGVKPEDKENSHDK